MKLLRRGYTLIELLMVMAIIGAVGLIAYYAINATGDRQAVSNAQLEFVSNLRSVINAVNNGAGGVNNRYIWLDTVDGDDHYDVRSNDGSTIQSILLPATVRISIVNGQGSYAAICAANPNMGPYTNTVGVSYCPPCSNPNKVRYFACESSDAEGYGQVFYLGNTGQTTMTLRFSSRRNPNTVFKDVEIEGSGMAISRVTPVFSQ